MQRLIYKEELAKGNIKPVGYEIPDEYTAVGKYNRTKKKGIPILDDPHDIRYVENAARYHFCVLDGRS